jgi:hypothetical protein
MKRVISIHLIASISLLTGCSLFLNTSKIYNEKISLDETLTIRHTFYRDHQSFYIRLLTQKKDLLSIEVLDAPEKFVINKLINDKFTYRLVTDTANFQLKCLDYDFLPSYCNKQVLSTFVPISDKEKLVFTEFSKALREKSDVSLNKQEIDSFKGWVKIVY